MESFRNACNKKCQYYAFQRNATTPNSPIMAKSHPVGCIFVMGYLQAFRFGYAPFRFAHFA